VSGTVVDGHEIAVDLTDPELYRQGFPHELFVELRRPTPSSPSIPRRTRVCGA
jgi:hypothetical protein